MGLLKAVGYRLLVVLVSWCVIVVAASVFYDFYRLGAFLAGHK